MRLERWFYTVPLRLRSLLRRRHVEQDLDDEFRYHLDRQIEQHLAQGMPPEHARDAALRAMHGIEQRKEECRDMRRVNYLENLIHDIRYAVRMIRRNPGFALVAVLTLALGIGANTAIFSTVDSVVLRRLPFADPERLVMLWEDASYVGFPRNTPAAANYVDWKSRNQVFTDIAATSFRTANNLTTDGPPEQILGRGVTANFFSVLGVQPLLGRTFTEPEDRAAAPVVVISHSLWQRRYLGDPDLAGKSIVMDGAKITVLGVMPRDFVFRDRTVEFWVPAAFTPQILANRQFHYLNVVARLRPGVTLARAREDMEGIAKDLARQYPANDRVGAAVVPLKEDVLGNTRTALLVLMSAAGCVLLIACANLASLLLARAVARHREISVRAALGAGKARLIRQMITEGAVLSLAGGALGLAVAPAAMKVLASMVPGGLPDSAAPGIDFRLLAFTLGLSLITGIVFSAVPAIQAAYASLNDALKQGGRGSSGVGGRLRDALVVVEVAAALVLLVAAGLMLQTLAKLRAIDVGFRSGHLLTLRTALPRPKYNDAPKRMAFYDRVLDGVRALPGVEGAAYVSTLPFLSQGNTSAYQIEGRPLDPSDPGDALYRLATADYLKTLGVRVIEGRLPDANEAASPQQVVVVNETFARRYWPHESALGHRLTTNFPTPIWATIIGVVSDVRERGYQLDLKPGIYTLTPQVAGFPSNLVVRATGDPRTLTGAIRHIVSDVDPEQPIAAVRTMDEIIDLQVSDRRQQLILLGVFGGLSLLLAAIGLYGVLSYGVTRRSREIGLRMALGASAATVTRMVVRHGLLLTAAGLVSGLLVSWAVTRAMRTLLYGVTANDPVTLSGVAALLAIIAAAACWIPARRASRVDPVVVLREE